MKTTTLLAFAGLALACSSQAFATDPIRTVALTGTSGVRGPALGTSTFENIDLHSPAINNSGQVFFRGVVAGSQGVWSNGILNPVGGANTNAALAGGARPGGGTYPTGSAAVFSAMNLNSTGVIGYRAGGNAGQFGGSAASPSRHMLANDEAPGTGGVGTSATYSSALANSPLINNAGQFAFMSGLNASTTSVPATTTTGATANASGLWIGPVSAPALVLRQNDVVNAIDVGGSVRVSTFSNNSLTMNNAGRYAFTGALQGTVTAGTGAGSNANFVATNRSTGASGGSGIEVIARTGNAAPDASGVASSDLYRGFGTLGIGFNDAGRVGFTGTLRDAAGTQTATSALWVDTGSGVLRQAARNGNAVPTMANSTAGEFAGVTWNNLGNQVVINANDITLVNTTLNAPAGTTNLLAIMDGSNNWTKIARSGDIASGTATFNFFGSFAINSAGQVAFTSSLGNATAATDGGLYGWDPVAGMQTLAREGDALEVLPGVFRTIAAINVLSSSGGQDSRIKSLTDNGQVAFRAEFTDGSSGVFVASIVPAPGALGLAGLGGLIAARRRRSIA